MTGNIAYQTDQLVRYFSSNRISWSQFYDSERVIIERLQLSARHSVLDIGCGCGGLGLVLRERYGVQSYTGVEINALAAETAGRMNPQAEILCGDILQLNYDELAGRYFNVVFSLSCIDWNVQFAEMLAAAWRRVAPDGYLVATLRLTDASGCADIGRSYQYINYDGVCEGERACYVVLNASDLMARITAFDPSEISAYGYWRAPSATAVTPYERLCFCALAVRKSGDARVAPRVQLDLPDEIRRRMESA